MYLSQLIINPNDSRVRVDIVNPYEMHRTVLSGFPQKLPIGERVLFRFEEQLDKPCQRILVQSHTLPNWETLFQRGYLLQPAAVKNIGIQPRVGQVYRFQLVANPTKRLRKEGLRKGGRVGLMNENVQLEWLKRKSELNGFLVLVAQTSKVFQPDGWKLIDEKKNFIRQHKVRFEGCLQVTDVQTFISALKGGIGSGKSFGCGLLSIAPA